MFNPHTQIQDQEAPSEKWCVPYLIRVGVVCLFFYCVSSIGLAYSAEIPNQVRENQPQPTLLKLSLEDALALFLKQNFELIIGKYGIDSSKGRAITAGLFPNPTLTINTLTSYTQTCNLTRCGAVMTVLSQMFEVAGKRGFRIESAGYGTKSSEAMFEDTIRQLRFAVKDAYFRVQVGRQHLKVDKRTLKRIEKIIEGENAKSSTKIKEQDKIWFRIQSVEAQAQVIHDIQDIDAATGDLQILLGLNPEVELELTTPLEFHRVDPKGPQLHQVAVGRPDIQAKRLLFSRRKAELRLANSISVPNVNVDLGYMIQGPQGPDNQQQWTFNLGVPLPIFDQNQGGIMVANADLLAAQADLQKTLSDLRVEVDTAFRRMMQSRRLVEAYQSGVLEDVKKLFRLAEKAYDNEKGSAFELLEAGQTASDIFENYLEALFSYQRDVLLLESSIGQDLY